MGYERVFGDDHAFEIKVWAINSLHLFKEDQTMSNLRFPELNRAHLAGRLTHDPDFHYTESGKAVARLNIAVNQSYKDKNNEWQQETSYVPVIVWEKTAEAVQKHLSRGSAVLIEGKLKSRQKKMDDGKSWTVLEVTASNVQFLSIKEKEEIKEEEDDEQPF